MKPNFLGSLSQNSTKGGAFGCSGGRVPEFPLSLLLTVIVNSLLLAQHWVFSVLFAIIGVGSINLW